MEWAKAVDNLGYLNKDIQVRNHLPIDGKRYISIQASPFHVCQRNPDAPKHMDSIIYYDTLEIRLGNVSKEDLLGFNELLTRESEARFLEKENESVIIDSEVHPFSSEALGQW